MAFDLAPGNILQALHFRRRLRLLAQEFGRPMQFIEIGAGTGWLSEVALSEGCGGVAFEINPEACEANARRNAAAVKEGRYRIVNRPFSSKSVPEGGRSDLVFSCMLLEHLTDDEIREIVFAARSACHQRGVLIAFVPAAMSYWGIEDEVAGHLRRYDLPGILELTHREHLRLRYWTGLTFPLSNLLRTVSNRLVARAESSKLQDSLRQRTVASGFRQVPFKTRFPDWIPRVINEWTLRPFDLLQRAFGRSDRSMVLYCEWDLLPNENSRSK